MNKKKIFISGIIAVVIIALVIIIAKISNKNSSNKNIENAITKFQWIQMLTEEFGITEYSNTTPYFKDVNPDNEYFANIQSAYEWGLFEERSEFKGEEPADGEFAVLTAMKAVGKYKVQIYMGLSSEPKSKDYIELAIDKDLVTKSQLNINISLEDGQAILEKASDLYLSKLWVDDYAEIKYQDNVTEIEDKDIEYISEDYTQIKLSRKQADKRKTGEVIIFSEPRTGQKMAKQLNNIGKDGMLELGDVDIDQVVDKIVASDVTSVTAEHIMMDADEQYIGYSGRESTPSDHYYAMNVSMQNEGQKLTSKGFSLVFKTEGGELSIEMTSNDTGIIEEKSLKEFKKIKDMKGTVEGVFEVKKIDIGVQVVKEGWGGVEYVNVQTESDMEFRGEISISEERKIPIGKAPITLAGGAIGVDVHLYLVLSIDGSVSLQVEIPVNTAIEYIKGVGVRNYSNTLSPEASIHADCTAECKFRIEPIVKLLYMNILDLEVDVGAAINAEVTSRFNSNVITCADLSIAAPIVTIYLSGDDDIVTVLNLLDIAEEWPILTAEDTLFKKALHYEWYLDGESAFVDECTYREERVEPIKCDRNYPIMPTYAVFDTPVEDKNHYYTAIGKLYGVAVDGNAYVIDPEYKFIIPKGASVSVWESDPFIGSSNIKTVNQTLEEYYNAPTPDYRGNVFTIDTGLALSIRFNILGQVVYIGAQTDNALVEWIDGEKSVDAEGTSWTVFGQSLMGEEILERWEDVDGWDKIKEQSEQYGFVINDCYKTESGTYVFSNMYLCKVFDSEGNITSEGFTNLKYIGTVGVPYHKAVEGIDYWRVY